MKKKNLSVFDKAKVKLAKLLKIKFATLKTDKGDLSYDEENGEIEVGTFVYVEVEDGEVSIPENGDYVADGKTYTIEDGIVTAIKDVKPEEIAEEIDEDFEEEEKKEEEIVEIEVEDVVTKDDIQAVIDVVEAIQEEVEHIVDEVAEVKVEVAETVEELRKAKKGKAKSATKEVEVKNKKVVNDRYDAFMNGWKE